MSWDDRSAVRRRPVPWHTQADNLALSLRADWRPNRRRPRGLGYGTLGDRS